MADQVAASTAQQRARAIAIAELELEDERGKAPQIGGIYDAVDHLGGIEQSGILRSPSQVGNELGTAALTSAGAMLVPEIGALAKGVPYLQRLAPKAADAGIGALRTFGNYLRTGTWASAGDYLGNQAAQEVGMAPETTGDQDLERFLQNLAMGTATGYGADASLRGLNRSAYNTAKAAADPAVNEARLFAERSGFAKTDPLDAKVDFANSRAAVLDKSQAAELGANAGQNSLEIKLGEELRAAMPELRQMGIFQAETTDDLLKLTQHRIDWVNRERSRVLADHGSTPITLDNLGPSVEKLRGRVEKLRKSGGTDPIADSIAGEMNQIMADLHSPATHGYPAQPKTVADAVDMVQNLNEQRRKIIREFNAQQQAGTIKGDVFDHEGSIEAISEMQKALMDGIESVTGTDAFSTLNQQQSALRALQDSTEKFHRGIDRGRATRSGADLVKTAGQQGAAPTTFGADVAAQGPKRAVTGRIVDSVLGADPVISPGAQNALRVEGSSATAMENIRALQALNETPAMIPPGRGAPLGGRGPQSAIAARDLWPVMQQMFGPSDAQAQQPPPVFPRDTAALLQNRDLFLQTVAQASPQLVDDVRAALSEPNASRQQTMLSALAKGIPQLFAPGEYYSLWDGKITDPAERPLYSDLQRTRFKRGEFDANHLAASLSAVNADGTVVPPPQGPTQPGVRPPMQGAANGVSPREYSY